MWLRVIAEIEPSCVVRLRDIVGKLDSVVVVLERAPRFRG